MNTKLFRKGAFGHGTILLNWHGDPAREYRFFAEAFHLLGKKGARALKRRGHFPSSGLDDFHACPIVFLYRHALELYVKAILFAASPLRATQARRATEQRLAKTNGHALVPHIEELEAAFGELQWPWPESLQRLRVLGTEFDSVDDGSFKFRYPTERKGGKPSLPPRFQFDLFTFCKVLDELLPDLDGWVSVVDERVDERLGRTGP